MNRGESGPPERPLPARASSADAGSADAGSADAGSALAVWDPQARPADLVALTTGHINASFRAQLPDGSQALLQRVSRQAFRDPHALMRNLVRALDHLQGARPEATWPHLLTTPDGRRWIEHEGEVWRLYQWITDTKTFAAPDVPERGGQAARAFGAFAAGLRELPPNVLERHLAGFHDPTLRDAELASAEADASEARREAAASVRARLAERRPRPPHGPLHIVHGDTKLSNVLFSTATDQAVTVVDLDTVMPGPLAWDFGDLMRSVANTGAEGEANTERVAIDPVAVAAVSAGFAERAGALIVPWEVPELARAPAHMAHLLATRFLTDYLAGDVYFRTAHPRHNLDRARTQLCLAELFEVESARIIELLERALA